MLLKIFIKRDKQGKQCVNHLQYCDSFHESSEILKEEKYEGEQIKEFSFTMNDQDGETWTAGVKTKIQGYELYNSKGVLVEKYVTPIEKTHLDEHKMTIKDEESNILKKVVDMGRESLDPDLFTVLEDKIVPELEKNRHLN